ncbi:unnamed protein product [Parascedosporium putredinis]|uniref:Uncharacterized protein n=1 Tax=Parascedosporium putredinis TaxID=1442378 RepID=A0A9P1M775_9PEZI|nr:unnamed protein product [Parascedosporium putredinis]CAI7987896.1 unnamed protein product [Parascedosporium putredinis]
MAKMSKTFTAEGYEVTITPLLDLLNDRVDAKGVVGVLAHFRPSAETRAALNGPDDGFKLLHEHAKRDDWMRLPVRHKGRKSEILTSHFVQNYGAPYKYVVSVASKSFENAPDVILRALLRMTWAGRQVMEGANTLGPTVATLSLGSPSTMSFRPKLKGKDKKGNTSVLDLRLLHGDIVVMHGTDIHRCYEVGPKSTVYIFSSSGLTAV